MTMLSTAGLVRGDLVVQELLRDFADEKVKPTDFGFTYRFYPQSLRNTATAAGLYSEGPVYGYRDNIAVYPASTCKAFYLVAFWEWVSQGRLEPDAEDFRALAAMIQQSSNDATTYILGRLTGTTPGPCLPPDQMAVWWEQRQAVHRFFQSRYPGIAAGIRLWHSTYEDSPYGRERDARQHGGNFIHPKAAASLMHGIVSGQLGTVEATDDMMRLLDRNPERDAALLPPYYQDQVRGFMGGGLPDEVRLWSKAGHTSETRHDIVYLEWPDGAGCIAAIYTTGLHMALNVRFLPAFTQKLLTLRQ